MKYQAFVKQVFYFFLVGTVAVSTDFLVYTNTLQNLGSIFAKLLGFYAGVIVSFLLNSKLTFKQKNKNLINSKNFVRYFISLTFSMCLNVSINFVLITLFDNTELSLILAFIGATFVSMCFNFMIIKYWVFR
ncbi:GtrA family protein [Alphaproteobacteria bacterium]|nr:GtrA family protein [Alphaproteobacteria bacterium]